MTSAKDVKLDAKENPPGFESTENIQQFVNQAAKKMAGSGTVGQLVTSVNGKLGDVALNAADVGAATTTDIISRATEYNTFLLNVAADTSVAPIAGIIDVNTKFGIIPMMFNGMYGDAARTPNRLSGEFFQIIGTGEIQLLPTIKNIADYLQLSFDIFGMAGKRTSPTIVRIVAYNPATVTSNEYLGVAENFTSDCRLLCESELSSAAGQRATNLSGVRLNTMLLSETDSAFKLDRGNWIISLQAVTLSNGNDTILAKSNGELFIFLA